MIEQSRKGVTKKLKQPLHAEVPGIENVAIKFIRIARAERQPQILRLIPERDRTEAETCRILNFHASKGCVEKFLEFYHAMQTRWIYGDVFKKWISESEILWPVACYSRQPWWPRVGSHFARRMFRFFTSTFDG